MVVWQGAGRWNFRLRLIRPDGSTLGDAKNVKLRFDDTYLAMAAEGGV